MDVGEPFPHTSISLFIELNLNQIVALAEEAQNVGTAEPFVRSAVCKAPIAYTSDTKKLSLYPEPYPVYLHTIRILHKEILPCMSVPIVMIDPTNCRN